MIQKGDSPLFYFMDARGIPVSGAWISVFGSVSGGA